VTSEKSERNNEGTKASTDEVLIDDRERRGGSPGERREGKEEEERYCRLGEFRPSLIHVWLRPREPNKG
jgi:hypothetical protein